MKIRKIWELLERFKNNCKSKGWKTSKNEDWVETENEYHNFVLVRSLHPSSFTRITSARRCAVREGVSYKVVEVRYLAWLLSNAPDKSLWAVLSENPEMLERTAIYDLSPLLKGENFCLKINKTESPVFQEFEKFLEQNGIQLKPIGNSEEKLGEYAVALG